MQRGKTRPSQAAQHPKHKIKSAKLQPRHQQHRARNLPRRLLSTTIPPQQSQNNPYTPPTPSSYTNTSREYELDDFVNDHDEGTPDIDMNQVSLMMKKEKVLQIHRLLRLERYLDQSPFTFELDLFTELISEATNGVAGKDAFVVMYNAFLKQETSMQSSFRPPSTTTSLSSIDRLLSPTLSNSTSIYDLNHDRSAQSKSAPAQSLALKEQLSITSALANLDHLQSVAREIGPNLKFIERRLKNEAVQLRKHYTHQFIHLHQPLPTPSKPYPNPVMPQLNKHTQPFLEELTEQELRRMVRGLPSEALTEMQTLTTSLQLHLHRDTNRSGTDRWGPSEMVMEMLPISPYKLSFPAFLRSHIINAISPRSRFTGNYTDQTILDLLVATGDNGVGTVERVLGQLKPQYEARAETLQMWIDAYRSHLAHFEYAIAHPTTVYRKKAGGGRGDGVGMERDNNGDNINNKNNNSNDNNKTPTPTSPQDHFAFLDPESDHRLKDDWEESQEAILDRVYRTQILPNFVKNLTFLERHHTAQLISSTRSSPSPTPTIFLPSLCSIDPLGDAERWLGREPSREVVEVIRRHIDALENEKTAIQSLFSAALIALDTIRSSHFRTIFGDFRLDPGRALGSTTSTPNTTSPKDQTSPRKPTPSLHLLPLPTPPPTPPEAHTAIIRTVSTYRSWLTLLDQELALFDPTLDTAILGTGSTNAGEGLRHWYNEFGLTASGKDAELSPNQPRLHLPTVFPRRPGLHKSVDPKRQGRSESGDGGSDEEKSGNDDLNQSSQPQPQSTPPPPPQPSPIVSLMDRVASYRLPKWSYNDIALRLESPYAVRGSNGVGSGNGGSPKSQKGPKKAGLVRKFINYVFQGSVIVSPEQQQQLMQKEEMERENGEANERNRKSKISTSPDSDSDDLDPIVEFKSMPESRQEVISIGFQNETKLLSSLNRYKTLIDTAMYNVVIRHRLFVELYQPFVVQRLGNGEEEKRSGGMGRQPTTPTTIVPRYRVVVSIPNIPTLAPDLDQLLTSLTSTAAVNTADPIMPPATSTTTNPTTNPHKTKLMTVSLPELTHPDFFAFPTQYYTLSSTLPLLPAASITLRPTTPSPNSSSRIINPSTNSNTIAGTDRNDGDNVEMVYDDPLANLVTWCAGIDWDRTTTQLDTALRANAFLLRSDVNTSEIGMGGGNGTEQQDHLRLLMRLANQAVTVPTVAEAIERVRGSGLAVKAELLDDVGTGAKH